MLEQLGLLPASPPVDRWNGSGRLAIGANAAMHHALSHRLAPLLLASSLLLPARAGAEPAALSALATQHSLVLTPQVVHTGVEEFKSDTPLLEGADPGCDASEGQVGYTHNVYVGLRDSYRNCVWRGGIAADRRPRLDALPVPPNEVMYDCRGQGDWSQHPRNLPGHEGNAHER